MKVGEFDPERTLTINFKGAAESIAFSFYGGIIPLKFDLFG